MNAKSAAGILFPSPELTFVVAATWRRRRRRKHENPAPTIYADYYFIYSNNKLRFALALPKHDFVTCCWAKLCDVCLLQTNALGHLFARP